MIRRSPIVCVLAVVLAPAVGRADTQVSGVLRLDSGSTAESWCNNVAIVDGTQTRVVAGNLQIGCPSEVGATCTGSGDCLSGHCVDGVCCSSACNQGCGACNLAGAVGTCRPRAQGTQCRAAASALCDVAEYCAGNVTSCPVDAVVPAGRVCREDNGGGCDAVETCNGFSGACPPDQGRASGALCRVANAGGCDVAETCTGTPAPCPADVGLAAGTRCHESAGVCDPQEVCSGSSAPCPPDVFDPVGTECSDDGCYACNLSGECSANPVGCDDAPDLEIAGIWRAPINGSPADINLLHYNMTYCNRGTQPLHAFPGLRLTNETTGRTVDLPYQESTYPLMPGECANRYMEDCLELGDPNCASAVTVSAIVDPGNSVPEINETDNAYRVSFAQVTAHSDLTVEGFRSEFPDFVVTYCNRGAAGPGFGWGFEVSVHNNSTHRHWVSGPIKLDVPAAGTCHEVDLMCNALFWGPCQANPWVTVVVNGTEGETPETNWSNNQRQYNH